MSKDQDTLEAEILDSIQPFSSSDIAKPESIFPGQTMQRTQTLYTTAMSVQQPRSISRIANNMIEESRMAGKSFYYRWQAKNKKTGKMSTIEGPSIDMTMALLRYYGNVAVDVNVDETNTHYLFKATIIDLESGMSSPRLFRQRKTQNIGSGMDAERQEDIIFQIGQSKAIRNAIRNAMPGWLIEKCIEAATEAELNKAQQENPVFARAKVIAFFLGYGVEQDRIESKVGRKADLWTPQDIVDLRGNASALKEGRISADELFPKADLVEENKSEDPAKTEKSGSEAPTEPASQRPEAPPEPEKHAEQANADPWATFRSQWINLKGAGFSTYVHKNKAMFLECPKAISMEAMEKWVKLYPGVSFPTNAPVTDDRPSDKTPPVSTVPISYTPEYQELMKAKEHHPEEYATARKELNVSPGTVENCLALLRYVNMEVEKQIDSAFEQPSGPENMAGESENSSGF